MAEKVKPQGTKATQVGGGDAFGSAPAAEEMATVQHGPYAEQLHIVGMSVEKVRKRYADRFDIHPQSQAILDGKEVPADMIILANQVLMFVRRAGEKGSESLTIEGSSVTATSPEGQTAKIELSELLKRVSPPKIDTAGTVLPDGVRAAVSRGETTIWIHETPPRIIEYKWIKDGSPANYGPSAKFDLVKLGMPYVVVFAVFQGKTGLGSNECFFRTSPLVSFDDTLAYPALLNCSNWQEDPKKSNNPISWICTQHLNLGNAASEKDDTKRMRQMLRSLLHCLHETGFNRSSESHEGSSGFLKSSKVIPEVATVKKWQERTEQGIIEKDNLWPLDINWIDTKFTVREVIERIFKISGANQGGEIKTAEDLARVIFNRKAAK